MPQVFLSWSGEQSRLIADALKQWLPRVFQGLRVWMSEHDIQAGERWRHTLYKQLETSNLGIVCLTPENLDSLWLVFEAGALSKAVNESRVIPYRFELKSTDIGPPLAQFQSVGADEKGTKSLIESIHAAINSPIPSSELPETFEVWWPHLEKFLSKITHRIDTDRRSEREILEEILALVRRTGSREIQTTIGRILAIPNVHSMTVKRVFKGGFTGEISIQVIVHRKMPLADVPDGERIPDMIYGMPIKVVEVRNIRKQKSP